MSGVCSLIAMAKRHIPTYLLFLVAIVQGLREGATNEESVEILQNESCFTILASDGELHQGKSICTSNYCLLIILCSTTFRHWHLYFEE